MKHYDVLICGGGIAGVCAALAAARENASVMLVERNAFVGGNATAGLVSPFMGFTHDPKIGRDERGFMKYEWNEFLNGTLFGEIINRVKAEGGLCEFSTPLSADPEIIKYVLEQMLLESGVEILYAAQACGTDKTAGADGLFHLTSVDLLCKEGVRKVSASRFIDATGDADLTYFAGGSFLRGDDRGVTQAATLMFLIDNVDEEAVAAFRKAHPDEFEDSDFGTISGFRSIVTAARQYGDLSDDVKNFVFFRSSVKGRYAANITHYFDIDATLSESITHATIELRKQMMQVYRILRRDVPGFSESYISASGSYPGIRESRRICGQVYFTMEMRQACPMPEKYLARCSYPIDLHMKDKPKDNMHSIGLFGIPEGTCIHREFNNLYAAGRNLSTDRLINSAIRVMGVVAGIGESVGKLCLR